MTHQPGLGSIRPRPIPDAGDPGMTGVERPPLWLDINALTDDQLNDALVAGLEEGTMADNIRRELSAWAVGDEIMLGGRPQFGPRAVVLARLAATLEAFPALRIGQLLINASAPAALFYVTDADLATALDEYTRKWGR